MGQFSAEWKRTTIVAVHKMVGSWIQKVIG